MNTVAELVEGRAELLGFDKLSPNGRRVIPTQVGDAQ